MDPFKRRRQLQCHMFHGKRNHILEVIINNSFLLIKLTLLEDESKLPFVTIIETQTTFSLSLIALVIGKTMNGNIIIAHSFYIFLLLTKKTVILDFILHSVIVLMGLLALEIQHLTFPLVLLGIFIILIKMKSTMM